MCEFCHKHGEGKKWYLQAKNYSDDLLSDARRRRFIEEFFKHPEELGEAVAGLDRLEKAPKFIRSVIGGRVVKRMKKTHYGQVLPIEDVERIFEFVNSVVRLACICRQARLGKEKRYCYAIALSPGGGKFVEILRGLDTSFLSGPDTRGLEVLSKENALAAFRDHEQEGLCHSVWTFRAPFIGGICNCDRSDCLAMLSTVTYSTPVMFRSEYVAGPVDRDACNGCRQCMRVCQFGAISYSASDKKVTTDQRWCFGCGVCRAVCQKDAIHLEERTRVPAAANLW